MMRYRTLRHRYRSRYRTSASSNVCCFDLGSSVVLPDGGYRRFWQEAELPCHADVIAGGPMFDDQAVFHPEHVDVLRLEALAGRRYARQQPFVYERVLANSLMGSTKHTTRHDPIPFRQDVERRHFHIRECIQDVLKYCANHIAVDRDTVIDHLVGEKFALSCESFLFDGLEHLPNGNFILFYHVHYSFNFGLKMVQFNVWSFREKLHKLQSAFSDRASVIAHDIDRLTEHWDAESASRAIRTIHRRKFRKVRQGTS